MKKKTLILNLLIAVVIGFLSCSAASATAIVTYSDSFDGIGTWTYNMTVVNTDPDILYDFKVNTGSIAPLTASDVTGAGWLPTDVGADYVHWMADFGYEIPSGGSMGGFWFTYSGTASDNLGIISFETTTWHDDPFGGYANAPDTSGNTSPAPTPVPEAGTVWLILTGLILIGLGHRLKVYQDFQA